MPNDNMIAALLRERTAYESRGLDERVALVDEQLAHHGYEPEPTAARGREAGPELFGRTADSGQQTADAQAGEDEKRGRGRPKLPRDADGNIVRG